MDGLIRMSRNGLLRCFPEWILFGLGLPFFSSRGWPALPSSSNRPPFFAGIERSLFRVHKSLDGATPEAKGGRAPAEPLDLKQYSWQAHCHGLFDLAIAA